MEKKTLSQIEAEIAETKAELENVHGNETEVYARIVGYYRAVKHWNKGKRDEFNQRKMFTLEASTEYNITEADGPCACSAPSKLSKIESAPVMNTEPVSYELFTRKTCPNCPPVKSYVSELDMPGRAIDVDTKEGLEEASEKGIFASPTVIFYNKAGVETARCHNVEELEAIFESKAEIA